MEFIILSAAWFWGDCLAKAEQLMLDTLFHSSKQKQGAV
jgi:hypothetical protein